MTDPDEIKCRMMAELLGVLVCSDRANYDKDTIRLYVNWPRTFALGDHSRHTTITCWTWAQAVKALGTLRGDQ